MRQLDVTTAYLNGNIKEEIFMKTPEYLREVLEIIVKDKNSCSNMKTEAEIMLQELKAGEKVCLLNRSLYGLRQAGRMWYVKLNEILRNF